MLSRNRRPHTDSPLAPLAADPRTKKVSATRVQGVNRWPLTMSTPTGARLAHVDRDPDVVVQSDLSVFGRVAFAYAMFAAVVGALPATVIVLSDNMPITVNDYLTILAFFMILFVVRTSGFPWWWLRAGRTRYEVVGSKLRFWNGPHLIDEFDCADIYLVRGEGYIDWKSCLFNGFGPIDFPRLTVRTSVMHTAPPILLWREDATRAFHQIKRAVNDQGRGQWVVADPPGVD